MKISVISLSTENFESEIRMVFQVMKSRIIHIQKIHNDSTNKVKGIRVAWTTKARR